LFPERAADHALGSRRPPRAPCRLACRAGVPRTSGPGLHGEPRCGARRRRCPARGRVIWLTWRQHRVAVVGATSVLLLTAAGLVLLDVMTRTAHAALPGSQAWVQQSANLPSIWNTAWF